ncbi:MAG: hypothetical protein KIT62_07915 [Cyclobacteriaceae bacterium]|nr:hypothetical protein [Cyclobacteriaceae bacterium]
MKAKLFLIVIGMAVLAACSKKDENLLSEETEINEWAEMDAFHMIMAEAFHPFKDSANLEPAKNLAEEMAAEAGKWAAAELPAQVASEDVKNLLEKLKTDTRALADEVKAGATNEQIGADLTALHDNFHSIMEAWHKGKGEKHEHQH